MKKEHMEVLLEDIKGKFDLVLEGNAVLQRQIQEARQDLNDKFEYSTFLIQGVNKKVDAVEERLTEKIESVNRKVDAVEASLSAKIDAVDKKVDAVAADLTAHRADTESHEKTYRVSE